MNLNVREIIISSAPENIPFKKEGHKSMKLEKFFNKTSPCWGS